MTTSMRVAAETALSSRVRKPAVWPTGLAEQRGHAGRGGAGGQAARLEHQDAAVAAPGRLEQGERHQRGLAGAGRRDEHGVRAGSSAASSARQGLGHGKVRKHRRDGGAGGLRRI